MASTGWSSLDTLLLLRCAAGGLHKHGREGHLLRSRACAGLFFAFFYSLLSSLVPPSYQLLLTPQPEREALLPTQKVMVRDTLLQPYFPCAPQPSAEWNVRDEHHRTRKTIPALSLQGAAWSKTMARCIGTPGQCCARDERSRCQAATSLMVGVLDSPKSRSSAAHASAAHAAGNGVGR